jgi:multidrug resistance efflux pump
VVLLVSTPLLYLMGQIVYTTVVVTAPGFITLEKVPINSQMAGWVCDLSVRVGEEVSQGQILASLESPELQQREQLLRAEAASHELASPVPSGAAVLQELERSLDLAQKVVDYHASHLERVRFLFKQGAATIAELNLAQSQLHQTESDLQQMRSSFAMRRLEDLRLQAPDRSMETRSRLIQTELEAVLEQRARLTQRSPVRGRVLEVFADVGFNLAQGQPILMLGNLDKVFLQAYLDAEDLEYARAGQRAVAIFEDGRRHSVVVRQKPEVTARLPAAAVPALGERQFMLLVMLDFVEPLSPEDIVDNLPLTVRFPFELPILSGIR